MKNKTINIAVAVVIAATLLAEGLGASVQAAPKLTPGEAHSIGVEA